MRTLLLLGSLLVTFTVSAGWQDTLKGLFGGDDGEAKTSSSTVPALSNTEVINGLLQALEVGTKRTVDRLGKTNGFLKDPKVRIPIPDNLRTVEKGLRALGQDKYADEFIETMNHAAEDAVTTATPIFIDAIKNMSFDDARRILNGHDDAATRYFKKNTHTSLTEAFLPIVSKATDKAGVTSSYKKLVSKASFAGDYVNMQDLDIDRYVTGKALDGLYLILAEEEKRIRKDPVARSTELLKKVFSSLD
jgi:hypothetical protein